MSGVSFGICGCAILPFAVCLALRVPGIAAVILSEIHYNPTEGSTLEFIELQNLGAQAVSLSGWGFSRGVDFVVEEGVSIAANGFLVIARDPRALLGRFGVAPEQVLGPFGGALDNGGERLELRDAQGTVIDSVRYDDDAPWDARAAGQGGSLERICVTFESDLPANWTAEGAPTPLRASPRAQCPPPNLAVPAVAFNEIHYHAANFLDPHEEFVELVNNTTSAIQLKGYRFSSGIEYTFGDDSLIQPGEVIAVCRDADHVKRTFGVARAYGNFGGQLSNDGERIGLVDSSGTHVDSVIYSDRGDWPVAPDGLGASLEKIRPDAPSSDPMSWKASDSGAARNRQRVVVRGRATSTFLELKLDQRGECLLDNVTLVDLANPTLNLIAGGDFDRGIGGVNFEGSHFYSGWDPTGGTKGTGALRLKAKNIPGGKGLEIFEGVVHRAFFDLTSLIRINGPTYELAFDFTHLSGWRGFSAGFLDSTPDRGLFWRFDAKPSATPGRSNTALSQWLSPHVTDVTRSIKEPGSGDAVSISARVRSEASPASVKLDYNIDLKSSTSTIDCADDGAHGDGKAGDGVFGATLPMFPHNTIVTYRIRGVDVAGNVGTSPPESDPTGVHGFYVNDLRPASRLPTYQLLLQHRSQEKPLRIIEQLDCQHYWTGSLAHGGDLYPGIGIRMRGASVCRTPKPYMKLRFQRGREFERQRKLNFQGLWTDKSLIRERLCWDLFEDLGYPACRDQYIRLHVNGQYYGLFSALENPDEHMLERNGLDPDGNLYKSVGSSEEPGGGGPGPWEKKTNENGDHSDLIAFLKELHSTSFTKLRTFFPANTHPDRIIEYQLAQVLINNFDHTSHNHYLYHDLANGKWIPLPWDLDLTFGKGGVFDDSEMIPGFSPWFATAVDGEFGNYLLDRFFSDAGSWYRRAYLVRLHDTLQERFTEEFYEARFTVLKELLFEEQDEDIRMWGRLTDDQGGGQFPRDFLSNVDRVRFYVKKRREHLLWYLDQRSKFTGHERLMITELHYNPPGQEEKLEFIELWNPGEQPIGLSGWSVEGVEFAFPQGARAEARSVLVLAKDPVALEGRHGKIPNIFGPYAGTLDNDGEMLRVRDRGPGHPATVDFLSYSSGGLWPRGASGFGRTLELTEVSTWRYNDRPESWRASDIDGGTPGMIATKEPGSRYHRGDVNSDGSTNLGDVLATLGFLFQGKGEVSCPAASDLNGSGDIKLDDALFLLRYLFQGAPDPIPFPGPGECAPIAQDACPGANCS